MRVRKSILIYWLPVLLLLAACSSTGEEPAGQQAGQQTPDPVQETEATQEVVLEAEILPAPSNTPAPLPTEATDDGSETSPGQEGEVAEPTPAETQPTAEPEPTAAPVINGEYEDTFYRGLATAPITMIDYSDFL